MKKLEIELDETTYEKIEQLTKTHHCQVSNLIKALNNQHFSSYLKIQTVMDKKTQ
ncbi:MAG: hypothetical protein QNJ37_18180 [Crocosphaera sp.]|nr:hypothetical protein [Crocosphaera sp.]